MNLARIIVRRRIACALTLLAVLTLTGMTANAAPVTTHIDGSVTFGAKGALQNGATLDVSTEFIPYAVTGWNGAPVYTTYAMTMMDDAIDPADATGDFVGLPFTIVTTTVLKPADLAAFAFTSTEGVWATTSGSIITSTDGFLDMLLIGSFTPTGTLANFAPASGELRISLNQTGPSLGLTSTMKMTGPIVPEPATMSMLGLGALALLRRRRRK